MFRVTIRELLLVTLIAGMGTAWGLEHRALVSAREDAEALARYGDPHRGACGNVAGFWCAIAEKYAPSKSSVPAEFTIMDENEAIRGIDIAP